MSKIANATEAWDKARTKLREAERIDPTTAPGAMVHSAYYAMHHAARAVLLAVAGTAAVRHDKVIQEFGLLAVKQDDAELKDAGRAINRMMTNRNIWDYEAANPTEQQAKDAASVARSFLAVCAAKFHLQAPDAS